MDPLFIALVGVVGGGVLIKGIENLFSKSKDNGPIAISAGEDYDRRWEDPEYVKMIHKTRTGELEALGEIVTPCECKSCTFVKTPLLPTLQTTKPGPAVVYNEFNIAGHHFRIRSDQVPADAHGTWDERLQIGFFKWIDAVTGKTMGLKAIPTDHDSAWSDFGYNVYSDQYSKPIASFGGKDEEKTHTIFTRSGPKKISMREFNEYAKRTSNLNREIAHERDGYLDYRKRLESDIKRSLLTNNMIIAGDSNTNRPPEIKMVKGKK
jgi:hypothetical protein